MSDKVLNEKIDFDGDLQFSGKDLDITWAYLQVKKLFELGDSTIDTYNFNDKVIDQYNLNKNAGIAEPNDNQIQNLPGRLQLGMPAGLSQIVFTKKWTLNDMFAGDVITNNRTDSIPTDVFESVNGETSGNIVNGDWVATKNNNTPHDNLLALQATGGELQIDDKGSVSNITSWVLHWKAKTRFLPRQILLIKGDTDPKFTITALSNKRDLIQNDGGRVDKVAILSGVNVYNFFQVPFGKSWEDYSNTYVDFYLVREGQDIRLLLDNHNGEGPLNCPQEIPGSLPTIINMNEQSAPLTYSGSAYEYITDLWFSDGTTNTENLHLLTKPATRYQFASDLNRTTSYFAWANFFADKFGGFAQIFGIDRADDLRRGSPNNQTQWTTEYTQDGTQYGWTTRGRCLKLDKGYKRMDVENFKFDSNFTVAFWLRTGSADVFLKCSSGNNDFTIQRRYDKEAFDFRLNGVLKSRIGLAGLTSSSLSSDWHHITIVKNRNVIGIWLNKQYIGYFTMTDAEIANLGFTTLEFTGAPDPVYFSDTRVVGYALSNIPANDYGKRTSYDFIDKLQERFDI